MKAVLIAGAAMLVFASGCREADPVSANQRPAASEAQTAGPPVPAHYLPHAQTNLTTIRLFIGGEELRTELALKPTEIFTGMMWRTNMAEGDAMLFVFPTAERRSFYMKNTFVPLSVAYIDPEGIIQEIHDLQPRDEQPVPSQSDNIQFVLEVKQGWFKRHNVGPGALVRTQFGELKRAFTWQR